MFKICLLIALAVAGVRSQELVGGPVAAPEPYSYAYQTDSHAANEERDPSGKVTGSYTLVDADGRERRVDYIADEAGFRAKVQTNELGTKSENSADVEVLASPPTEAQLVVQRQQVVQQPIVQPVVQQARVATTLAPAAPIRSANYGYPGAYGYGNGYGYGNAYGVGNGYGYSAYGYPGGYANGYGYGANGYLGAASGLNGYANYNNHLPAQYYRSLNSGVAANQVAGVAGVAGVRYVTAAPAVARTANVVGSNYRVGSYQTLGAPAGALGYNAVPSSVAYANGNLGAVRNGYGSSNYIVLKKKRDTAQQ